MSLASCRVIAIKALDIVRHKKMARQVGGIWHSEDLAAGLHNGTVYRL